ncbi:unnamed protein product [Rotaria sordida]|uniref:Uncharacterized protein n=1 Tax=Rotaria sordida TaxID=392033 RepID=A0A815UXX5_9BILA|nr:unnamed protein product [Rotaria sordida]CAF1525436.1 unnamed protein product [Rotaria sordida]
MTNEEENCGWNLAITYMLSSTFKPDRSCLNKISQIDFSGLNTLYVTTMNKPSELTTNKPNEAIFNIAISIKYILSIFISILILYLTSL